MMIVVAYDVVKDKSRRKISDALLDCGGRRVQYSVFECELKPVQLEKLQRKLHKLRGASDSIRYYRQCQRCLHHANVDENPELRQKDAAMTV